MRFHMQRLSEPDSQGLREFAWVTGGVIIVLFGLFLPWIFELDWPVWPWMLAIPLVLTGWIAPMVLRPIYRVWMQFGLLVGKITTPIIMGLVFFLVITPTGLLRRLLGGDPMARKFNDGESYRVASKKLTSRNMEKPF